ncbi:MAG: hypothetical protein CMM95_00640 [Rickettsiales bacterium]|nr:hypothetical protein [Rickettsiales bacterium]
MINLKGRKGIIFGSTGFLGKQLAMRLSKLGSKLILHGRSLEELKKLDDEIKSLNVKQILLQSDLLDRRFYDNLLNLVSSRFEKLDFLINVSGSFVRLAPLTNFSHNEWNEMIEINLSSFWRTLKELEYLLKKSAKPKVIFLNNEVIGDGKAFYNIFSITNAAMKSMAKIYYQENKRLKIQMKLINVKILNKGITSILNKSEKKQSFSKEIIERIIKKGFSDEEGLIYNI